MQENTDLRLLLAYIESVDASPAEVAFCEIFNEKSSIWNFNKHTHERIELIYFLKGKASVQDVDQILPLSVFELAVYPQLVPHQEILDAHLNQEIICLQLDSPAGQTYPHAFKLADPDGDLQWILRKIHREYKADRIDRQDVLNACIHLLWSMIRQNVQLPLPRKTTILDQGIQFIHEHYQENIDVARIASAVFVSPSYLTRLFQKNCGMAPMQYLNAFRIEAAKRLLLFSNRPLQEIADQVGLEPRHFGKVFKRFTGLTPAAFRKSQADATN